MQRFLACVLLVLAGALGACVPALSTPGVDPATEGVAPPPAGEAPAAKLPAERATVAPAESTAQPEKGPAPAAPADEKKPAAAAEPKRETVAHLALLLPLKSSAFARAAEITRQGFSAASQADADWPLPVRVYDTGDEPADIGASYRSAVEAGAKVVVGPLTRGGVSALASSDLVKVPTLALNVPDGGQRLPPMLYAFSLQTEAEARQIARLAAHRGRNQAIIVYADTPLDQRVRRAFADEWRAGGGFLAGEHAFSGDLGELPRLRLAVGSNPEQLVFLALDFVSARLVKPFLDPALRVYATSQVNVGKIDPLAQFDLGGVRFVDMPWLLQPDHPAVMAYARLDPSPGNELERLYALGIDAFRLARLIAEAPRYGVQLDGVTGRITLGADRYFFRELTLAAFRQGEIVIEEAPAQ